MVRVRQIEIVSPKQDPRFITPWNAFFPYYAGYPEQFASLALNSLRLREGAVVLDPWNGSGTTPYAAAKMGLSAIGLDINPVMAVVAKARILPSSESSALVPLGMQIIEASKAAEPAAAGDPLCIWFGPRTASHVRAIECEIRRLLIGRQLSLPSDIGGVSCIASAFYVALFSVVRLLLVDFKSSNPTWLRTPKKDQRKVAATRKVVTKSFERQLAMMADALAKECIRQSEGYVEVGLADSTFLPLPEDSIDAVLTSPPYCTRIDYATTTRAELAVLSGLLPSCHIDLGRRMLGSIRVPRHEIQVLDGWGGTCKNFLDKVSRHGSKASSGYYLKTHLDYFDKLDRSIGEMSRVLKEGAIAILVVQDSFYKDVHNDVPQIVEEISLSHRLRLTQRNDFPLRRSMAAINRGARAYRAQSTAVEAVLCFQKD